MRKLSSAESKQKLPVIALWGHDAAEAPSLVEEALKEIPALG